MTEKPKPQPAKVRPVDPHYGEMREPRFPTTIGSRIGGWLAGLLMPWKR